MKKIILINNLETRDGEVNVYYDKESFEYICSASYPTTKIEAISFRTKEIDVMENFLQENTSRLFNIQRIRSKLYRKGLSREMRDMIISLVSSDCDFFKI